MDKLAAKFLEEATDLIIDLEKALLLLEAHASDDNLIGEVFRVMHSLKGTGAMFGFEKISALTHNLENIYDLIRASNVPVSEEILTVTLSSVDCIKSLLKKNEKLNSAELAKYNDLLKRASALFENVKGSTRSVSAETGSALEEGFATYLISFKPSENIFRNGTNPLYLLDEFFSMGNCKVIAHDDVPSLDDLDPAQCYCSWHIVIATKESQEAIRQVFMFVEDDSIIDIEKLAGNDLLADTNFINAVEKAGDELTTDSLREIVDRIHADSETSDSTITHRVLENQISSIRVSSEKLDNLMNMVSELITEQARLSLLAEQHHIPEFVSVAEKIEKISRQIRNNAFSICLIPFETLFTRFRRLVRDLSIELGKEINLVTEDEQTEIDKTIIESLTDPLLHIIRNSIDHGIETPVERLGKGKAPQGRIRLKAFYSGNHIHIRIEDDGRGIDPEKIKEKAIENGLLEPGAMLSNDEALQIIFLPGFSTASEVTEVSGRGVGMDVVKKKISEIRGDIEITSTVNKGTQITLKLPLTLSIIDGLLVKVDNTSFVVPLSSLDRCYEITQDTILSSFNSSTQIDGEQMPFFDLRREFDIPGDCPSHRQLLAVRYDHVRVGLIVDSIVGEYQAVLKPLGQLYKRVEILSGATILGDGTIALIVDTNKIIKQLSNSVII
jgi:two-component system, chemotaxis family, sensor kinase CheA